MAALVRNGSRLELPDFCAARATLAVVLIVTLIAVILTIARADTPLHVWLDLARISLFLLWTGLGSAALLCALRPRLSSLSISVASAVALGAIGLVVALVSLAASILAAQPDLAFLAGAHPLRALLPLNLGGFVARNVTVGLIVGGLALRYFHVAGEWRRNVEMQARARVDALQARIRPHFLYNSMNTIAALTRSNPEQAERCIEDLSDLFRVSLDERRSRITLQEELQAARTYQQIEQRRLGARLRVEWDVGALPPRALVPSLLLQPLLENAINHGIEPRHEGGTVTISGALDGDVIGLTVRNPLPGPAAIAHEGNRVALDNIRERLSLMYPRRAELEAARVGDEFVVRLRFPYTPQEQGGDAVAASVAARVAASASGL